MHELALCDAMLKMVRDISREQALEGVRSITVRVGTLSGVVPRFLTDCWVAVTDGTEYDGVPLRVETEAGRARCLDCGAEFEADVNDLTCPGCGAPLDVNASARCPYCGTVIQQQAQDWVISAIRGIKQQTL